MGPIIALDAEVVQVSGQENRGRRDFMDDEGDRRGKLEVEPPNTSRPPPIIGKQCAQRLMDEALAQKQTVPTPHRQNG